MMPVNFYFTLAIGVRQSLLHSPFIHLWFLRLLASILSLSPTCWIPISWPKLQLKLTRLPLADPCQRCKQLSRALKNAGCWDATRGNCFSWLKTCEVWPHEQLHFTAVKPKSSWIGHPSRAFTQVREPQVVDFGFLTPFATFHISSRDEPQHPLGRRQLADCLQGLIMTLCSTRSI